MEVPRQLSVDERSPFYRPDVHDIGPLIRITLDGEVIAEVVEYDLDAGMLKRFIYPTKPGEVDDQGRSEVPVLATHHGRVQAEWRHMV